MKFGLKEATIQKICDVFARYPQVKKAIRSMKCGYSPSDGWTSLFRENNASTKT